MIASFKDAETEKIFRGIASRKRPSDLQRVCLRKLLYLHSARTLDGLRIPPGNRLERLKGNRSGQYSIRINDQWKLCFRWAEERAWDVEMVDYH